MRSVYLIILVLLGSLMASAQKSRHSVDPVDLDYETNLLVPNVPEKQESAIRSHMGAIQDALNHLDFKTERTRDNEVLTVLIPCSDLFAPNSTVLKESAKSRLQHFAKFLKYPTMYKIVVAVFTDNTGEPQYCETLSGDRANAIDDYLIELGLSNGLNEINVIPYGMGQTYERVPNSTIENRAQNRRVEISIIPEWQMIDTARAGKLNK